MADAHRYEDVTPDVVELVNVVLEEHFDELIGAKIKPIFDTKKRTHGGRVVLGRMQKCNELVKFLTNDQAISPEGFDFFLYLDKNIYQAMHEEQRKELVFHELCHCGVDFDRSDPYYVVPHDVETFYKEIEFHADDPRWYEKLSVIAEAVYVETD